jgi:hypothetical protein
VSTIDLYLQLRRTKNQDVYTIVQYACVVAGAHPREGGRGAAGAAAPPPNPNLKDTDFVDIMMSKVLRDFPFSRNQPLKSADDQYIRILKTKLIKLKKKNEKIGHCD